MFPKESDEVEKYVGGLPDMIQGSVMASKPKTMQDAIEFAIELMDQKIRTLAERQAENKRKRNRAEDLNLYALNATTIMMDSVLPSAPIGHFKSNFPKLKNKNQGNQAGNGNVVARAYDVGTAGTNPNSNVVTGTFLLNNRYASILFDTCADRSFVSTAFSSLIDIIPNTLDHGYDIELADEMGSFDIIIVMDWLSKYHVVIAHVTARKAADKSEEKRLEDVPITKQEHEEHLKLISEFLRKEELYAKYEFWVPKVQFLSHVIDTAIQLLKEKLCSAPILALPEGAENFIAYCDGLLQKD
ncbi:hypothetical protein Tco_0436088 [Tanacetum coccineum]